ncbi:MAG: hypothetical protein PVH96_06895 [Gemmatimonadota bacterium]|jgi:hypothetical protein
MAITRRSSLFSILVLSTALAACEPSTAPDVGVDFDSEATLDAYQEMDSLLASPSLAALDALAGRTPFGASPAGVDALAAFRAASAADDGRAFALALAERMTEIDPTTAGPAAAPIISDFHRGTTFVYDAESDQYVADPGRDDAPETGVRFVLYETDLFGSPVSEDEIGYADLVDEGDDSAEDVALHLTVFAYETTVLDYRTTLDIQQTGGTLGVHGFLSDPDGGRLDFDIDATSTQVGEGDPMLDVAFELAVDEHDFSINGTVSGVDDNVEGDGTVELTVRHADDSIRLDVEGEAGQIDGSVFVNGSLFATVTGDASDPDIASATGDPLTLRELLVLHRIVDGAEDVFDFLEDLLDPVDELVFLAIIL